MWNPAGPATTGHAILDGMSDGTATATTEPTHYGKRAAARPAGGPPAGAEWPYATCVRFCEVPHDLGGRCRSGGEDMFLGQDGVDAESGELRFALVFVEDDEQTTVGLSAYQASVLLARVMPDL